MPRQKLRNFLAHSESRNGINGSENSEGIRINNKLITFQLTSTYFQGRKGVGTTPTHLLHFITM